MEHDEERELLFALVERAGLALEARRRARESRERGGERGG
jgi:hypothetical protein